MSTSSIIRLPPMDVGWLYNRAVEDPDGHVFEAVWMDISDMAEQKAETA
jgi:predicted lactoylglutathione lyase